MAGATAVPPIGPRIDAAAAYIGERLRSEPTLATPGLGLVLGSGLGAVVDLLDPDPRVHIPYRDIPEVPSSSVVGHAGELVAGFVGGRPVLVFAGRVHAYEGYSHREVTILIRAAFRLGLHTVVLTNAAGGMNPAFEPGELWTDHINLSGDNLFGPTTSLACASGPTERTFLTCRRAGGGAGRVHLHEGVYISPARLRNAGRLQPASWGVRGGPHRARV